MLWLTDRVRRWTVRLVAAAAVAGALAVIPAVVLRGDGRLERLDGELTRARQQIRQRELDNADKRHRVQALKEDPRAVEEIARGELGMTYPGELVIRVEDVR